MSADGWIDKENVHIHAIEPYSVFKRKDILSYATAQVNFEDIMLSETN